MRRNLDNRMETIVPVTDPALRNQSDVMLEIDDRDNCSAWDMQPDSTYGVASQSTGRRRARHRRLSSAWRRKRRTVMMRGFQPRPAEKPICSCDQDSQ